jgi:serine/threonine-protein kinase
MGGLDVRRASNEIPDHDVSIDAFWMDQLEVTNAMYALCVNAGGCTPPQSFKSQRRASYFNNPEFNDYPVIYVAWGQAKTYCEWAGRRLRPKQSGARRAWRRLHSPGRGKADGLLANFSMLVKSPRRDHHGEISIGRPGYGVFAA